MTTIEKIGLCFGVAAVLGLIGLFFFSGKGWLDFKDLQGKETLINERVRQETLKNREIEKEIYRLKHDLEYIRHRAQHDQGMAAENEFIFKVKTTTKDAAP